MKINWSYFTKQRGIVIVSLVMCLVILGSANYIYTKCQNDLPDIPSAEQPSDSDQNTSGNNQDVNSTDTDASGNKADTSVSTQSDYFEAYRTNRQSIRDMEMRYVQTISDNQNSDAAIKKEAESRLLEIVEEGSINIDVKAEQLSSAQATKILKIVVDETGEASQNITIITRL